MSQWAEEVGNIWALSKRRSSPQTLLAVAAVEGSAVLVVQDFGKAWTAWAGVALLPMQLIPDLMQNSAIPALSFPPK